MSDKQEKPRDEATIGIDTTSISVDDQGNVELAKDDLDKVVGGRPASGGPTNCFHCLNPGRCELL